MLNHNAVQKDSTLNPPTIFVHNKIRHAFITNRKIPRVKIVTGSVNNTKIGFTKMFNSPKTIATIIEVEKFFTWTSRIKCDIINTKNAVIRIRSSNFIVVIIKIYRYKNTK